MLCASTVRKEASSRAFRRDKLPEGIAGFVIAAIDEVEDADVKTA